MFETPEIPEGPRRSNRGAENAIQKAQFESEVLRDNRADLIELLLILTRHKKAILLTTVAVALVATSVMLLTPSTYTATATILPPQQKQSSLGALLGQISSIAALTGSDLGLNNLQDMFIGMLRSRTVEDRIIDRFDLRKVYAVKGYEDARKKLGKRSTISLEKEGLISVSVEDRDPSRAAGIANAYVEELHSLNAQLSISEAGQRRSFYQNKVDSEREALSNAEAHLKEAEEQTGLLHPEAQARVMIQSVADMRAQVADLEVKIQTMRTYATKDNPELRRAEEQLAGLRAQVAKMVRSNGSSGESELPTRKLPEAELEYIRRARDLKYHESLYEFLTKQMEAARIDEAKDAVLVQVVDKAVAPERKSSPHRATTVLLATFAAFLIACVGAFLFESFKRRHEQDSHFRARVALLRHDLHLE